MASTNSDNNNKNNNTKEESSNAGGISDRSRNEFSSASSIHPPDRERGMNDIGMRTSYSLVAMMDEPPPLARLLPPPTHAEVSRGSSNIKEDSSSFHETANAKRPLHDEYMSISSSSSSIPPAPPSSIVDKDSCNKRQKESNDMDTFSSSGVQASSTIGLKTAVPHKNNHPVTPFTMNEPKISAASSSPSSLLSIGKQEEEEEDDADQTTPVTSPVTVREKMIPVANTQKEDHGGNNNVGVGGAKVLTNNDDGTAVDDDSRSYMDNSYSWGRDEDYENMPKTPLASTTTGMMMHRQSTGGSASSYSDLSSLGGGSGSGMNSASSSAADLARTMSPLSGLYIPEVPPAPPSTPASTVETKNLSLRDFGLATPLPYSAGFVQNTHHLEQQQLLADGAVTPAPPRPYRAVDPATSTDGGRSTHSHPRNPHDNLDNDLSDWAVGERYKLLRMLGRGSYGEVAQAQDLSQGRTDALVAIKRIQSPFEQEMDAVRLYREIHILRRLRGHDCIIKLLDVVQPPTDDLADFHDLYLVFEYVDTDLYKLIMSPQYLTTEHIQTFLYQMLNGLKYIHSASVIHRDLKPANILLNEDCSLKICDFGLARIVENVSVMQSSSSDQGADGKPKSFADMMPSKVPLQRQLTKHVVTRWYRAPELILIQPYTTAVDIWSLGCIFAELLSMQEGNVPGYQDRRPLFPGGACYPLSGDADNAERVDQLNVIFGVIGTPSKDDIDSIGKATEYIKTMKETKPKPLQELFPAADPAAIDLLQHMLKFNPRHRCTANEALEHGFFTAIRRQDMEKSIDRVLVSPEFLHQAIDIDTLKRNAYNEVLWFRDQSDGPPRPSANSAEKKK